MYILNCKTKKYIFVSSFMVFRMDINQFISSDHEITFENFPDV